ncbi:MAG: TonB-dependent receptor [Bacteroidales bacterium]|jgi:TonB-linked SusC/RagA family outer membrane protein|nr:TonB-dependent receptor [Bacteroidales bacterium]MCI1786289.1 TonB-dependent receptor [Bacteroidales bacterium]
MKKIQAKAFFTAALLCLCVISVFASPSYTGQDGQYKTLKGVVISSDDNAPLAGVVIHVKDNNKIVTTTNSKGEYSISVPSSAKTVVFQLLGYDEKDIDVKDEYLFTLVTMIIQKSSLDGVVVVGFGTQKKESVVGAVQAIKPSELVTTSSNLTTSFAGNIAGVIATQSSGEPGYDGANFYVRGISTFGSNTGALIVLDGVEITSSMLGNISPESIESMSILKDATATALYGSRGANGVVIITTKEGRNSEKLNVSITFDNTVSTPTKVQKVANAVSYMELYNEAKYNDARAAGTAYVPFYSSEKIEGTRNHLNPYIFPDNDWYSMLFKDYAMNQRLNISIRGGGSKVNYFLNASIFNENGILKKPSESPLDIRMNNKKYLFQSNVSTMVTNTTKVTMKLNMQIQYNHTPYESTGDLFYWVMRANPARFPAVLPAEDGDTFVRYGNNNSWDTGLTELNPYARMSDGYKDRFYSYMTAILSIDQDLSMLTKGLKAKALASFYNYSYASTNRYMTPYYFKVDDDYSINEDGTYNFTSSSIGQEGNTYLTSSVSHAGYHEWSVQGSLNYARSFGKHSTGADFVYHMKEKVNNAMGADEEKLLPFREQGLAGRLTYNFDKRYYMEANFGYNGSENFAPGKRFGFFPSVALGWTISNEKFFKSMKKAVTNLKLRASYGKVGNDALAVRFPYLTSVSMDSRGYYFGNSFAFRGAGYIDTYGNEDATWEIANKFNAGIDLTLFKDLTFTGDVFYEHRYNIFMQRQSLSATAGMGATVPYGNLGKVDNRGVDMSLAYNKVVNQDLSFGLRGTFTYAHNEVKAMDEPEYDDTNKNLSKIGHPMQAHQVLIAEGLFTSQEEIDKSPEQEFGSYSVGDIKYKDVNHDGKINANDFVWNDIPYIPEVEYGFGGNIRYKKWDLSIMFQGTGRYQVRMFNNNPFCTTSNFGFGIMQYIADDHWSWDNNNTDAGYPRLTSVASDNNTQASTFFLRKANYIRLKTAEIGYSFKSFRLYVSGSNLFTISPFKYWDPEVGNGTSGTNGNGLSYPLQRTYKIGIQYKF